MSGHSKWAKIKRQKGLNDAKRGNLFTKLAKNITLAAKEGGPDPSMNFTLRLAIDKAKVANMPLSNIDRAVERASGKSDQSTISKITYEALGPEGVSVIIDCQTDNTNRTVSEIRQLVETKGGKFASAGSISWSFSEKGLILVQLAKKEKNTQFGKKDVINNVDAEESIMEILEISGVEDINQIVWESDDGEVPALEIITNKDNFSNVLNEIENTGFVLLSAELVKVSNEKMVLDDQQQEKVRDFVEAIEDHDDVDSVWINI